MKTLTLLITISILFPLQSFCQDTIIKYFNNSWLEKEIDKNKAKVIQKVYINNDSSSTEEILNLSDNSIIRSSTYKDKDPIGIWIVAYGKGKKELNYNFDVNYNCLNCTNMNPFKAKDYLIDNKKENYIAPKLHYGNNQSYNSISNILVYPRYAAENEIQGTIELCFTINEKGIMENLCILKSVHPILDKEAIRAYKEVKVSEPSKINGQPISICIKTQVSFKLD